MCHAKDKGIIEPYLLSGFLISKEYIFYYFWLGQEQKAHEIFGQSKCAFTSERLRFCLFQGDCFIKLSLDYQTRQWLLHSLPAFEKSSSERKLLNSATLDIACNFRWWGTPLYGLNGNVQPGKVSFSEGLILNRLPISSIFVLNRVPLHLLM